MISVKIVADSITDGGDRLTTAVFCHPRANHADFMTHRWFSRNASSSRAIPASKVRELVSKKPYIPQHWGANQKGMQAYSEISDEAKQKALEWWKRGLDHAIAHHTEGEALGLHKQVVNRYIEPYAFIEVLVSGTQEGWANFGWLRNHHAADIPMQMLASAAWEAYSTSMPEYIPPGGWHLPYISAQEKAEITSSDLVKISTGRCARISYLTHEGVRDISEDIGLHDRLVVRSSHPSTTAIRTEGADPIHASPAEHPAMATGDGSTYGNFRGWKQYRKFIAGEAGPNINNAKCNRCGLWEGLHVAACLNNK